MRVLNLTESEYNTLKKTGMVHFNAISIYQITTLTELKNLVIDDNLQVYKIQIYPDGTKFTAEQTVAWYKLNRPSYIAHAYKIYDGDKDVQYELHKYNDRLVFFDFDGDVLIGYIYEKNYQNRIEQSNEETAK